MQLSVSTICNAFCDTLFPLTETDIQIYIECEFEVFEFYAMTFRLYHYSIQSKIEKNIFVLNISVKFQTDIRGMQFLHIFITRFMRKFTLAILRLL